MKKLIFLKFTKDTFSFFLLTCVTVGLIVWTMQAVNYFDFVTQDGHGLKTYFSYIVFNFPKIIHRILPFIFFISLFYIFTIYEDRNELSIFWLHGISKIYFTNIVIFLSIILTVIQIILGSFFSPFAQLKARDFLKESNIDFFTSLIKEGKFINVVDGLTIFINEKDENDNFKNIFLDDSSKPSSRMIYAKKGNIINQESKKIFRLFDGEVINKDQSKINVFKFDQIDFNLGDFSSQTILVPKIQERSSISLISCSFKKSFDNYFDKQLMNCEKRLEDEINQELLKRFYKPLYIPIIALLCCFLIILPKNNISYKRNRKIIFLITFFIILFSEASLRYATASKLSTIVYLITPWIIFLIVYIYFFKRIKNV
tara:strand:- start:4361 stop:5473 length:1113 start_codon:yes stop_codon:yes gene_type:complete